MKEYNVGILASASESNFQNEDVANNYKSLAKGISDYLATSGFNLVFGGSPESMTGKCYEAFNMRDKIIYAYTTEEYQDDFERMPDAFGMVCDSTFDVKKHIFDVSDIIVALPGGIGTYSEILSFIEEKRSNKKDIPIEIYDEEGYMSSMLIETLKIMETKGFVDDSVYGLFSVSHNFEEFEEHMDKHIANIIAKNAGGMQK